MKNNFSILKNIFCALISCFILISGTSAAKANSSYSVATNTSVTSNQAFVYYVSNGALYRVMTDGTKSQKLLSSFQGVQLTPVGNYLYYMYDEKSTTLLRIPMDGSAKIATRFESDVIQYAADGEFLYYMNEKGSIYRAPANAKNSSEATLVTDMADTNNPSFIVVDGRIYYNALKSGRTTWVASKAADGSGTVQWITSGAFASKWFTRTDSSSIYFMINTKPQETQYSTNCMVLYSIPRKGGTAKALNPKTPIDANAVYSGFWAKGYYMFNKDIKLDGSDKYNYAKGKGFVIDMNGNMIQLHNTGIYEIANINTNQIAFVDSNGKVFVSTINGKKVTSKKTLSLTNAGYVRNLITDGNVRATMIFAESGAYMLQSDLSLKKMVGIEWDLCMYQDDVSGFFYVNAGDNGRLYYMNEDGKTSTKLSEEKVDRIVLISKY